MSVVSVQRESVVIIYIQVKHLILNRIESCFPLLVLQVRKG